jgi:hypothetical protein
MFRPAMRTRTHYERALSVVRGVIHEWDPYALIGGRAPANEWDSEIASLVAQIPRMKSDNDAAHAISRVFSSAFQAEGFGPCDCGEVGRRLYRALQDSRLLEDGA